MHRRSTIVGLACAILIVATSTIIFVRYYSRPRAASSAPESGSEWLASSAAAAMPAIPRPGDIDPATLDRLEKETGIDRQKLIDKDWDRRPVVAWVPSVDEIKAFVESVPVEQQPSTTIDSEQLLALRGRLGSMLRYWGTNDWLGYFSDLRTQGETPTSTMVNALGPRFKEFFSARPSDNDASQWTSYFHDKIGNTKWAGFVRQGSTIRIYRLAFDSVPLPGNEMVKLRRGYNQYHPVTTPPVPLSQYIARHGNVTIADVQLFVSLGADLQGRVRVYAIRFWYDADGKTWRRHEMTSFSNPSEEFIDGITF